MTEKPFHPDDSDLRRRAEEANKRLASIVDSSDDAISTETIAREITDRKQTEKERQIAIEFLRLVNATAGTRELIQKATSFFQEQSGCAAIGIRLRDGNDYPYYETRGFPQEFVQLENSLCVRSENGEIPLDCSGNPVLDCMCGNVICGRFDPSKPFFTSAGSFWTNCTTDLLASTTKANRQARTRNRCNGEGYESVALIPLVSGQNRLGLLQLNDHRKGQFTVESVAFWERLAGYLAVAIAKSLVEEKLRESEQCYRSLFDQMAEGFALHEIICDDRGEPCDYRFLDVNPAFEQLTGLKRSNVVGKTMREVLPGEDSSWIRTYGAVALTGQASRFENYSAALDKHYGVFAYCPAPGLFAVMFTDVSARKAHEREIERLNRLYAALSELNQVIARVKTREELFREICRIATQKAGFRLAWIGWIENETRRVIPVARDGVQQDYLDEIKVYADDRPEGQGPTGRCIREDRVYVVHDFVNDPCTAPWHSAAAKQGFRTSAALPIRFQGKVWGALTAYDNEPNVIQDKEIALIEEAAAAISLALENLDHESQRKQAEERVIASEATLREAQELACLGSYVLDIHQGYWTSSEALDRIFDIPSDYARTIEGWGDLVHPDQRQAMLDYFRNEVFGKHVPFDREYRILRYGDKQVRWVHGLGRLEFDATGHLIAMLGTIQDITERKQAEQEKLELECRLLHAQKLESIGILAGGIAHDFNNILAGIMGYADLVKLRLPESEPVREDIEVIKKAVRRAADLTRQMLAYSGKGKFIVEPVSLSRVVEESKNMLAMSVSKKAAVRYSLASDLPTIQADASQIDQVILNLVVNASDALGEQDGVISISTDAIRYDEAALAALDGGKDLREGLYVRLEVSDTGCGMDQETLGKIFDPFFTTKFAGRGLGLAAVHGIVRGHKGAMRVASEPGKGTKFEVLFPASDTPAPLSAAESVPAKPWRGTGTVLVADDEEMVRNLASRMIAHAGFTVLTANDGEEAVRVYREHQGEIVCVLLDLTMPKMNGEETFHALRQVRPDVRVILSSGYGEEATTERFSRLGLAGFIQKPYQFDTMIARLRGAVAGFDG